MVSLFYNDHPLRVLSIGRSETMYSEYIMINL